MAVFAGKILKASLEPALTALVNAWIAGMQCVTPFTFQICSCVKRDYNFSMYEEFWR